MSELSGLIQNLSKTDYNEYAGLRIIKKFETEIQAINKVTGEPLRHYSISDQENKDLTRVLGGFKRKGKGIIDDQEQKRLLNLLYYANSYSQVANLKSIESENIISLMNEHRAVLSANTGYSAEQKHQASARLLACMREIYLRKTNKWVNHTQMLDLIYAAVYNDESLVHQVRTGQGKSIISQMRVAYLALNGHVVDLFSSKESLSQRDHEESSHVLDAMGIRNAYITPSSPGEAYQK